jgi:hypothetical protein
LDNELMAIVFGSASIRSAVVAGETPHTRDLSHPPLNWFRRGFQFYDTGTQTILRDVVFRNFHQHPYGGPKKSSNNCALYSMTHSDQFTPQRMNATKRLFFDQVDEAQRICHDDTGTLSSRNFNFFDSDGSATRTPFDGIARGPRWIGAGYTDTWRISSQCVRSDDWGLWTCPQPPSPQNVAAVSTSPNVGVRVVMYDLAGQTLGENWYSPAHHYDEAQITGPSGVGWHHSFPGGVPEQLQIGTLQVPESSFVLYSFSLPPGVSCSIQEAEWRAAPDLASLLATNAAAYTTDRQTCFVRIPPTYVGAFESAGLSIPNQTWRGTPTSTTYFTVITGCTSNNFACQQVVSRIPILP